MNKPTPDKTHGLTYEKFVECAKVLIENGKRPEDSYYWMPQQFKDQAVKDGYFGQ